MEYILVLLLGFMGLLVVISMFSIDDELGFVLFMQFIWTCSLYGMVWAIQNLLG